MKTTALVAAALFGYASAENFAGDRGLTDAQLERQRKVKHRLEELIDEFEDAAEKTKEDYKTYEQDKKWAAEDLKRDFRRWNRTEPARKRQWETAFNYTVENIKHESADQRQPASGYDRIYLDNRQAVVDRLKAADDMQKRHDAEVRRDFEDYFRTVKRSKKRFDRRAKRNARSVEKELKKLCDEIEEAERAEKAEQAKATTMFDTFNLGESLNLNAEQAMLYSMALVFTVGGAALLKKSQEKKTFEFEANDIEAPKKESKKEIKKTLKNIMQKNNA